MTNTIPVQYEGITCGELTMEKQGLFLRFTGSCTIQSHEILRAFLEIDQDVIPLGVAIPEGNRLHIQQTVLYSKIIGHKVHGAFLAVREPDGYLPWRGEICGYSAQGVACKKEGGLEVALALEPEKPFDLLPLICLFSYKRIDGKPYLSILLDKKGNPVLSDAVPSP